MMRDSPKEQFSSLFSDVSRWWRNLWGNRAGVDQLNEFSPHELHQLASDIGVSPQDLRPLAGKWPDAADLLMRRMAALQLDPSAIERLQPAVANDLKRTCSLCLSKGQCEHDLDWDRANPKWRKYCPNEATLDGLSNQKISAAKKTRRR
jgi:uncharacterized protein YjiS (DUF1127 family)